MASSSPLSYQTTMPEYPDVSYENWASLYGHGMNTRLGQGIAAWMNGHPDYNTWRTNELDSYNAAMSAYNTWLNSGAGIRASAESGNYNPSYFQGAGSPSASPLSYQDVAPNSGLSEMAQGISGVFQFAQAIQSMRLLGEQVLSAKLKNKSQDIQNKFLEDYLRYRNRGNQFRSDYFGFQADRKQLELEALYARMFKNSPDLWHGVDQAVFSPNNRGVYDLRAASSGYDYTRQGLDLSLARSAFLLRDSQIQLTKASKRDKDWFYNNVFSIQKKILEHSAGFLKGQLDFQKTEQDLRKAGIIAGISVNVINAAVNAIKTFVNPVASSFSPGSGQSRGIDPFDMVDMFGNGF